MTNPLARLAAVWSGFLDFCNPDRLDPARWAVITHEPLDEEDQ